VTLNGAGYTLQGNYGESGVVASGRTGIVVVDLTVRQFLFGITLEFCNNSTVNRSQIGQTGLIGIYLRNSNKISITLNTLAHGSYGIVRAYGYNVGICLHASSNNNVVCGNSITGNIVSGIELESHHGNKILDNNIADNWPTGISFTSSDNNTVSNNYIMGSDAGIIVSFSSNNTFFCNSLDNNYQVLSCYSTSIWDDGSRGNYWSDYQARYPNPTQTNGIWTTPYDIVDVNQSVSFDHYPLADQTIVPEFSSASILILLFTSTTVAAIPRILRGKHSEQV
jgi:parallel beta-helix repeat protein